MRRRRPAPQCDWDALAELCRAHRAGVRRIPGVRFVGVGLRMVSKRLTDEPALCVFVEHKVPRRLLAPEYRLPRRLGGLRVDVVQIRPEDGEASRPPQHSSTVLRPGVAIRNLKFRNEAYGTAGLIAIATPETFGSAMAGRPVLISAAHVIFASPSARQTVVNQVDQRIIARLARGDGTLDAGAALIEPNFPLNRDALAIGPIDPNPLTASEMRPGRRLKKSGAASGVTEGVVQAYDPASKFYTVVPPPELGKEYEVSVGGDSGALWLDSAGHRPALLHLEGEKRTVDPEFALGRPAQLVLSRLRVNLA